jgi:hypothetical protein
MGYKGNQEVKSGIIYAPYVPIYYNNMEQHPVTIQLEVEENRTSICFSYFEGNPGEFIIKDTKLYIDKKIYNVNHSGYNIFDGKSKDIGVEDARKLWESLMNVGWYLDEN